MQYTLAERSLLFKVMLGWIYLSFFCVQLHLKYIVSFDAVSRYQACSIVNKQHTGEHIDQTKSVFVKIKLNKRYQPEPLYTIPQCQAPSPEFHISFITFQENISTPVPDGFSLRPSLRGPPAC